MTVPMKKNDRLPLLRAQLSGSDKLPLNLAGATVTFRMTNRADGVVKIAAGPVAVLDAALGMVQYSWAAVDTDTAGAFDAAFVVDYAGLPATVPNSGAVLVVVE